MEAGGLEVQPAHRRRRRRRALKIGAVLVGITLLAGLAGAGRLYWRYQQVPRVPFAPDVLTDSPKSGPQNFLVVGSDSRDFVNGEEDVAAYGTPEELGPPRADTILLIRTFPDTGRAALVSFPRDLYLPIAGTGAENRINTAIEGGPQRLVQTISQRFNIPIHHYVQIDFAGFKGLVDTIGGVDINFPTPVRDWDASDPNNQFSPTGLEFLTPGCVRLNGDEALAYVRSRHYQQLMDGEWQNDPAGDLNRIKRQQDFIHRTLRQTLSRGLLDPRRLDSLLTVGIDSVTLDDQLGLSDLARLSKQFGSISPESLQTYVVPTVPVRNETGHVLLLDEAGAEPILNVFRGLTREPGLLQPNVVRTRVVDRTRTTNRVRLAAYQLAAAGFAIEEVTPGEPGRRTVIRYATGQLTKAQLVAGHLDGPSELRLDPDLKTVDVALVLGSDWKGVAETGVPVPAPDEPAEEEPPPGTEPTTTTVGPTTGC